MSKEKECCCKYCLDSKRIQTTKEIGENYNHSCPRHSERAKLKWILLSKHNEIVEDIERLQKLLDDVRFARDKFDEAFRGQQIIAREKAEEVERLKIENMKWKAVKNRACEDVRKLLKEKKDFNAKFLKCKCGRFMIEKKTKDYVDERIDRMAKHCKKEKKEIFDELFEKIACESHNPYTKKEWEMPLTIFSKWVKEVQNRRCQ